MNTFSQTHFLTIGYADDEYTSNLQNVQASLARESLLYVVPRWRVRVDRPHGLARFRWVKAPTTEELNQLAHTIIRRVGRDLERQGLLERDAENNYLAADAVDEDPSGSANST